MTKAELCLQQLKVVGAKFEAGIAHELVEVIQLYLDEASNEGRRMQVHNLKTWPDSFRPIWNGDKRHEFRKNDRDYRAGDELSLTEWDNKEGSYTGRSLKVKVTHVDYGPSWGIPDGYCVMSISEPYDRREADT